MVELIGENILHAGPVHDSTVETRDRVSHQLQAVQMHRRKQRGAYGDKAFHRKSHMRHAFKGRRLAPFKVRDSFRVRIRFMFISTYRNPNPNPYPNSNPNTNTNPNPNFNFNTNHNSNPNPKNRQGVTGK